MLATLMLRVRTNLVKTVYHEIGERVLEDTAGIGNIRIGIVLRRSAALDSSVWYAVAIRNRFGFLLPLRHYDLTCNSSYPLGFFG